MLRLVVYGYPYVSKTAVEYRLSEQQDRQRITFLAGWYRNDPSKFAYQWAEARGIPSTLAGSDYLPVMGERLGKRAEIWAIFKTYSPNRLVIFGDEALTEGGTGRIFANCAEQCGAELVYEQSTRDAVTGESRIREVCGYSFPNGLHQCTRYKNHRGKYHYFVKDGRHLARCPVIDVL